MSGVGRAVGIGTVAPRFVYSVRAFGALSLVHRFMGDEVPLFALLPKGWGFFYSGRLKGITQ